MNESIDRSRAQAGSEAKNMGTVSGELLNSGGFARILWGWPPSAGHITVFAWMGLEPNMGFRLSQGYPIAP
jgi:hypothetical protein